MLVKCTKCYIYCNIIIIMIELSEAHVRFWQVQWKRLAGLVGCSR